MNSARKEKRMDTETMKTKKRIAYVLDGSRKPTVHKRVAASYSTTVKTAKEPVLRVIRGGMQNERREQ